MRGINDISPQVVGPYLLALFAVVWIALAIEPNYRSDWALENVLAVGFLWWLVRRHRRRPFSNATYLLIFVFGCLHSVGAHYTYAEVPYDAWGRAVLGFSISDIFGLDRNHFDRLVHFLFGLLLFRPMQELYGSVSEERGILRYLVPVALLWGFSSLYEIVEWWAAEIFGGDLGTAYLGSQGDVWDAQKDMLAAHLGAMLGALLCAGLELSTTRMAWQGSVYAANFRYVIRTSHD